MSENSKIEWTTHTFNPWWGCVKVSAGCKNCYAEALDGRYNAQNPHWGKDAPRKMMSEAYWKQPLKWNKEAEKSGERPRVFCASMADVFENHDDLDEARLRLWEMIRATPYLDWLLLTKRPQNILPHLAHSYCMARDSKNFPLMDWLWNWHNDEQAPRNVWLGTSVENQEAAATRIPELLGVPAVVRFLSCEPLLGPLEFSDVSHRSDAVEVLGKPALSGIHWVICGGESGPNARPMHPHWARSLRDQCKAAGVAFHFKQHGNWCPSEQNGGGSSHGHGLMNGESWANGKNTHVFPDGYVAFNLGKHRAGRLLDGEEHNGLPQVLIPESP